MLNYRRAFAFSFGPALAVFAAVFAAVGCAHPQTVTLTSAATPAPVAPPAPVPAVPAPAPAKDSAEESAESSDEVESTPAADAPAAAKNPDEPLSFAQLSAQLGQDKIVIDLNQTQAPAGKGLSSDGYAAVGAAHQAVETNSRGMGDLKVSGGMTALAVRSGVRDGAARLRACYQHGLVADPRLAGRVMVTFSVDARGAVVDVDTESDAIPADVRACVRDAFSAMTFAPPKTAPAKIVYPVDFNKDS